MTRKRSIHMCIYIVRRSFTPKDKAKEVGELTQRVGETTESVNSEQDVGETTVQVPCHC